MRVRTDARRQAILETATQVFREVGYERASIAMISARVGGSKTTLYGYFKSKEELFAAAMTGAMEEQGRQLTAMLDPSQPDLRRVLESFGEAYLRLVTSDHILAIVRTAVAEAANSKLGPELYVRGPKMGWEHLTTYMSHLKERNIINTTDPRIAAAHFKGLLEAGIVEPLQYGAEAEFAPREAVVAAVDAFLRAYSRSGLVIG